MPQLMPLFWMNSIFMSMLLMLMLVIMYYYKIENMFTKGLMFMNKNYLFKW